jgi:hypothetical protein
MRGKKSICPLATVTTENKLDIFKNEMAKAWLDPIE